MERKSELELQRDYRWFRSAAKSIVEIPEIDKLPVPKDRSSCSRFDALSEKASSCSPTTPCKGCSEAGPRATTSSGGRNFEVGWLPDDFLIMAATVSEMTAAGFRALMAERLRSTPIWS
jgi:hypothetical protein